MQRKTAYVIGGVAAGLFLWWVLPAWVGLLVFLIIIGAPVVAYNLLDPNQKRRLKGLARKQIGSGR